MYNQGYNNRSDRTRTDRNGQKAGHWNGGQRNKTFTAPIESLSLDGDYLNQAEELMRQYDLKKITTSKIRRLYSLATEIYNEERLSTEESLSPDSIAAVGMMRVRIAYECGRDKNVKAFVQEAKLLEYLKGIDTKRENFIRFTQYMEALVAYHKFFGGREN